MKQVTPLASICNLPFAPTGTIPYLAQCVSGKRCNLLHLRDLSVVPSSPPAKYPPVPPTSQCTSRNGLSGSASAPRRPYQTWGLLSSRHYPFLPQIEMSSRYLWLYNADG